VEIEDNIKTKILHERSEGRIITMDVTKTLQNTNDRNIEKNVELEITKWANPSNRARPPQRGPRLTGVPYIRQTYSPVLGVGCSVYDVNPSASRDAIRMSRKKNCAVTEKDYDSFFSLVKAKMLIFIQPMFKQLGDVGKGRKYSVLLQIAWNDRIVLKVLLIYLHSLPRNYVGGKDAQYWKTITAITYLCFKSRSAGAEHNDQSNSCNRNVFCVWDADLFIIGKEKQEIREDAEKIVPIATRRAAICPENKTCVQNFLDLGAGRGVAVICRIYLSSPSMRRFYRRGLFIWDNG